MLSSDQIKNITFVYVSLLDSELNGWENLDDFLEILEWLDDLELYREAEILYSYHKNENMGCPYPHQEGSVCFVKNILDAVEAITDLYKETGNLHLKNRYILANYLALCQDGKIVSLEP